MTEIYHYHDNENLEYKQRILTNKTSCLFCEIDTKEILIQCKECEKLFCNGKNDIPKSHIIFHLQRSSHKTISIYSKDEIIKCEQNECTDCNIFNLYLVKDSNQIKTFCKSHIPREEKEKAIPYIGESNQISTEIVPEPSSEEDIKKLNETTLNEISKRENLIEELLYVANRFLNKVKEKYVDKNEYYYVYKPLILCELEYARKISENKKSYTVIIKDENTLYKKRPLYSFIFNQSHTKPFKLGNVYNFSSKNSDEKSLGLVVNIKKSRYFIIPVDINRDAFYNDEYIAKEEFCSVPYDRMIAALDIFFEDNYKPRKVSSILTQYILGHVDEIVNEEFELSSLLDPFFITEIEGYGKLNESQTKAIKNCEKHALNLIQGPPGTGKTFTASFLIYNILLSRKDERQKILVCAPTNAAADNISISLLNIRNALLNRNKDAETFNVLRIVSRTRQYLEYDKRVEDISLQKYVDFDEDNYKDECKEIIDSADIVVTTCSSSMIDKLDNHNFEFVVIDECTQSQEAETLLPMIKGSRYVALIGDQQQLSPTILHPKGKQTGMHITLFERIIKIKPENNALLETQYRMHPKIAEFISDTFYEGKLRNGVTKEERTKKSFNDKFKWPKKDFPIVFINVEGVNQISSSGTSFINEMECITLLYILNNKFPKEEIKNTCIITPYLGQKELIEEYLADHMINMDVSSVDSFQGQERDYIIINTVRNNKDCEIGFLKDAKRLNVSISRAKYGLIIIGNANCLYNAKVENKYTIWRRYIDYIKNNNSLVSFNMEDDKFEKYEFNQILNNEIVEGDYEEKYDFDGSKNNYKSNMDLINKSSGDNVSDHFYYNSVNNNEQNNYGYERNNRRNNNKRNKNQRNRNNYNSYNEGYNQRNYNNNGKNRKNNHY